MSFQILARPTASASAVDGDVATLDEIREAVTTLEDTDRIARRVLGSAHPLVVAIGRSLKNARSVLRARETPPPTGDLAEEVD